MTVKQRARRDVHRRIWDEAGVEYGLCLCGCGERTELARRTVMSACLVRGEPYRFVPNHHRRGPKLGERTRVDPNPAGVCVCGCGETVAPFASELPVVIHPRFVVGHNARKSPVDYVERDCGFESPCWVWQRKVTRKGYGIVEATNGRPRAQQAHRFIWEREVGPLADDLELHHRCEVGVCVNPAHCVPLTKAAHLALHWEARHAAC